MTDNWFLQEIEQQLKHRNRVVVLDPKGQCEFLLPLLNNKAYRLLKTDASLSEHWQTVKEELFLRHKTETEFKTEPVIFYITREQEKLSFLFDYCFTHGCIDLKNPSVWIKKKLFAQTGLQIQMDNPMLLTAAKLGIGKDLAWWKKILQNLEDLITIEDELLPFLHSPETYLLQKDVDVKRLFEEKICHIIGQPYIAKPPKTLAIEVVNLMFDSLLANSINNELLKLYYKWVDSETYSTSLLEYIAGYKLDEKTNSWAVHPDHCFPELDLQILKKITGNLRDKTYVNEKLEKIRKRAKSQKVKRFVPIWWNDILTLLEFNSKSLASCTSFDKVVNFYSESFSKVDRAIRNLYASFIQDEQIIRPLQEHYESLNHELLQQWFEYAGSYKSNQHGYLSGLIKKSKEKTAIIVGDGLRYEIANFVADTLEKTFKVEKQLMLADIPSETEHNMSALYLGNGEVLSTHKDREKRLSESTGKEISFLDLEALHYGIKADILVLTYKDIDSTGEKLQHGAIKLFGEFEQVIAEKITLLLKMGYNEVHLVTDHGFVLTGLLDEADKIEPNATGKKEVHERFIRTVEKQHNPEWLSFERPYGEYKFVSVAKSHRPFKSKGVYGFSHGGLTPQEIIVPKFIFRKEKAVVSGLEVKISNKNDLLDVTGELFGIKIQAASAGSNLFASNRKIQILLYVDKVKYSSSNVITIQAGESHSLEFSFGGNNEVLAALIDANTQEQIDSVVIKKSNARDLGGLF